jgi:hypothetical protein
MLEEEIKTIVELCNALQDDYESRFFEPVDENVMRQWENENKIMIPELYKEWLRFSNGAVIRGALAHFYGVEGFEVNNPNYPEDCVMIGDLIGDGERLAFSKTTGKILRINHGRCREYNDFVSFLHRMVIRMIQD